MARDGARAQELPSDVETIQESPATSVFDPALIRALIVGLPERQRLVLFLRYYADLDYEAIATALEISSGTVGATLHSAHAALRAQIEEVSCS